MIKKFYYAAHNFFSNPQEKEEYSAGYWQDRVRKEALLFCAVHGGKRILEVGCGEGLFLRQLARQDPHVEMWGIDNDIGRLERAKQLLGKEIPGKIHLLNQSAPEISFASNYFDTVVCINVFFNFHSLQLVERTFIRMRDICKLGGKIIFDFRNSLNPLLVLKYRCAGYYDGTIKNLPLNTYAPGQIKDMLRRLKVKVTRESRIGGFPCKALAPIVVIEAEKVC